MGENKNVEKILSKARKMSAPTEKGSPECVLQDAISFHMGGVHNFSGDPSKSKIAGKEKYPLHKMRPTQKSKVSQNVFFE